MQYMSTAGRWLVYIMSAEFSISVAKNMHVLSQV
jgi:hypothetical protein